MAPMIHKNNKNQFSVKSSTTEKLANQANGAYPSKAFVLYI